MIAVVDYHKGNLKSVERGLIGAGADAHITDDTGKIARADGIVLPGVGAFADASAAMFELGQMEVIRRRIDEGVPFLGICIGLHLMFEEGEEGEQASAEDEEPLRPRGLAILPGVVGRLPKTDTQGNTYKIPHVGWNTIVPRIWEARQCSVAQTVLSSRESATGAFGSLGSSFVDTPEPHVVEEVLEGSDTVVSSAGEARQCSVAQTVLSSHESATGAFGSLGSSFVSTAEPPDSDAEVETFACPLLAGIEAGEYFYFTHSYAVPTGSFVVAETTHSTTFPSVVQYRDVAFGVQFHPEKSSDAGVQVLRNFVNIVQGV